MAKKTKDNTGYISRSKLNKNAKFFGIGPKQEKNPLGKLITRKKPECNKTKPGGYDDIGIVRL